MAKTRTIWSAVGMLSLAMAGCGGGSGGNDPAPPPGEQRPGTPEQPNLAERIEPFDTLKASAAKQADGAGIAQVRGLVSAQSIRTITLEPLPTHAAMKTVSVEAGTPVKIGESRSVSAARTVQAMQALLQWQPTAAGGKVAAVSFVSPDAGGVRLGVAVQALPRGAVLRFYGAPGTNAVEVSAAELAQRAAHLRNSGESETVAQTYWSPEFGAASTTMEVEIPAGAEPSQVQVSVPSLSHFTVSVEEAQVQLDEKATSGSCNIDVMCKPEVIDQGRSVARMIYTTSEGSYLCTGTLLNDARSSATPYFLTANHCINTQGVAASLMTDWFYHSNACDTGRTSSNHVQLRGGASLLYASANTDVSFLRLNDAPPAGALYAGSYYGGALDVGSTVLGLHNPNGDLQKMSLGTVLRYSTCANGGCGVSDAARGTFYTVGWQEGTTEGGSSGSSMFYTIGATRYVAGQLYGGNASCTNPGGQDHYGRFDVSYRASIKQWLNPGS